MSRKEHVARIGRVEKHNNEGFESCLDAKLLRFEVHFSREDREQVKSSLREYRSVFALSDDQPLGCTSEAKHIISTGDAAPVYKKAYRVPSHQRAVLDEFILDQLDKGAIVPNHSDRASPVAIVPKNLQIDLQNTAFVWITVTLIP
ncbi:hypothetical protein J6590_048197 [Homalodisca vitripennis]|nr:hypothetical protein J6590_048197 [Homalodisca vitripennis]